MLTLKYWHGEKHQLHEQICSAHDRTLQVWELDNDGMIQIVIGPPEIVRYTDDGKPFAFSHPCYSFDENGMLIDWPLAETLDRPLETKYFTRLA